jgi:dienelactone hydrolase
MTSYVAETDIVDRPVRIFQGTPDDYNPVGPCRAYVERLKAAGRDVQLTEYPNAPHSFDNPHGAQPATRAPNSQSVRNCRIREEPLGTLINAKTGQPFTYKDPCVEFGPHIGHDPEATAQAKQAVTSFVQTLTKH